MCVYLWRCVLHPPFFSDIKPPTLKNIITTSWNHRENESGIYFVYDMRCMLLALFFFKKWNYGALKLRVVLVWNELSSDTLCFLDSVFPAFCLSPCNFIQHLSFEVIQSVHVDLSLFTCFDERTLILKKRWSCKSIVEYT